MKWFGRVFYGLLIAAVVLGILITFAPLRQGSLDPQPRRANSYEEALSKFAAFERLDGTEPIRPDCASRLLTHGHRTKRVYVLLHGLTNCPKQFVPFGQLLFDEGSNVLIPRFPYHGYADRLTDAVKNLRAEDITRTVDSAVDIANGLGDEVVIVGLSMSGAAAAWAAQMRPEVDFVVLLSPFLAIPKVPQFVNSALRNWANLLPNLSPWWDPELREELSGPEYAYARFSTRAIAQSLRLADVAFHQAERRRPTIRKAYAITSGADEAINHQRVRDLLDLWAAHGIQIEAVEIPAEENIPHDFIDPNQPDERTEEIYPRLLRWIEAQS